MANIHELDKEIMGRMIEEKTPEQSNKNDILQEQRKQMVLQGYDLSLSSIMPKIVKCNRKHKDELFESTADARLKQILKECMQELNKQETKVLDFYYFQEFSTEEIAEKMGKSKKAVRELKSKGLENLRKVFQNRLGPEIEDIKRRLH